MNRVSLCPFTVGEMIWQAQGGAWTVSICVKGAFALAQERDAVLLDVQEPLALVDMVPFKPRTDVIVVGHAHAPEGRPVDALVARFTIGDLTKAVGVVGDRVWQEGPDGLEPSPPAPFVSMPLSYERVARGRDNPAGLDLARDQEPGQTALPNLEAVDDGYVEGRVVGFGPIDAGWPSRRRLLDAASAAWLGRMEGPVPDGFEFRFFNRAPADQQMPLLRHGAAIVLENLSPALPRLESRLPLLRPKAFLVDDATQHAHEVALRCDTVEIDADQGTITLLWRGLVGVEGPNTAATVVVAAETPRKRLTYRHIERMLKDGNTTSMSTTQTEPHDLGRRHDGLRTRPSVAPKSEGAEATPVPPSWEARAPSSVPRPSKLGAEDPSTSDDTADVPSSTGGLRGRSGSLSSITLAEDGWGPSIEDFVTEERPPPTRPKVELEVRDFARISVRLERGEVGSVLNDYGLGLAELATLRETWAKKLEEDAALTLVFENELAVARDPSAGPPTPLPPFPKGEEGQGG